MPSNFLDKLQEALNPSDSAIKGSGLIVGMSAVLIAATAVTNPIAASMLLCAGMSVSLQVITDCIEGNKTSISSLVTSAAVGAASGAVAGVTAAATEIAITELGYNAASHFAVATISGASGATYDVTTQLLTTGKVDAKEVVLSTALAFGTGYALSKGSEVVSNKLNSKAVVVEKAESSQKLSGCSSSRTENVETEIIYPNKPHTNKTEGHWETILDEVERLNDTGEYTKIYINKGIRNEIPNAPINRRPDIMAVRRNGLIDQVEVPSKSDVSNKLIKRMEENSKTFGNRAGKYWLKNIEKGAF